MKKNLPVFGMENPAIRMSWRKIGSKRFKWKPQFPGEVKRASDLFVVRKAQLVAGVKINDKENVDPIDI